MLFQLEIENHWRMVRDVQRLLAAVHRKLQRAHLAGIVENMVKPFFLLRILRLHAPIHTGGVTLGKIAPCGPRIRVGSLLLRILPAEFFEFGKSIRRDGGVQIAAADTVSCNSLAFTSRR